MKLKNLLVVCFTALIFTSVFTGCDDGGTVQKEVIIVAYAAADAQKIVAYDAADGNVVKEVTIQSYVGSFDAGASAIAVFDNKLFVGCGNTVPRLHVFDQQLNEITTKDVQAWASSSQDNPHSIIIADGTHAYMSMMGQVASSEGSVIEFNPSDISFTEETVINADTTDGHFDNPNSLYMYNSTVYVSAYTMDSSYVNHGSYIYNVTGDTKYKDLTATNVQSGSGYDKYFYVTGTDKLEVIDLSSSSLDTTVVDLSGSGKVFVENLTGYVCGGYTATFAAVDTMWSFDPAAGTGVVTSICSDWGAGAVPGTGNDGDTIFAVTSSGGLRLSPFAGANEIVSASEIYTAPGAVTAMTILVNR